MELRHIIPVLNITCIGNLSDELPDRPSPELGKETLSGKAMNFHLYIAVMP